MNKNSNSDLEVTTQLPPSATEIQSRSNTDSESGVHMIDCTLIFVQISNVDACVGDL